MIVIQSSYAAEYTAYATEYAKGKTSTPVYKSIDRDGKVTYSSSWPQDTISVEKIAITPAPSKEYVEGARQRHEKVRETAQELSEAREKRKARREEEKTKRLERLALLRSVSAPQYERQVSVYGQPWWPYYPYPPYHGKPHKPSHGYPGRPGHGPVPAPFHRSSGMQMY